MRSIPACAGEPRLRSPVASSPVVYPRVCGGTRGPEHQKQLQAGLSPRVRGNHRAPVETDKGARSIPACAGEPLNGSRRTRGRRVYPRVCGGTRSSRRVVSRSHGLSPRVRGNLGRWADRPRLCGSIPACAGEPTFSHGSALPPSVYPRVCGGTTSPPRSVSTVMGLSPRVRGNPPHRSSAHKYLRSIPACAGEPPPLHAPPPAVRGLSPRVRGNPGQASVYSDLGFSIPACAGEPVTSCLPSRHDRVYPRVCGGTGVSVQDMNPNKGLSPRVRGNRRTQTGLGAITRSIPACAGEPYKARVGAQTAAVYPRVCGGTAPVPVGDLRRKGLSPRVRGNRLAWASDHADDRSIPACAGEPRVGLGSGSTGAVYPRVCGGTTITIRG